jgi:type I restriction enzyme R subunit
VPSSFKASERLEEILAKFGEDWEQLALALKSSVEEVTKGRRADDGPSGLDAQIHAPFFDILKEQRSKAVIFTFLFGKTIRSSGCVTT